jgi:hypothetical protein
MIIFITKDKTGRNIRLTETQWKHIKFRHPHFGNKPMEIKNTIENPTLMVKLTNKITKYYRYLKSEDKYIMVAVKILNHEGFIITAYNTKKIQK